jgi:hypothetical protein
VLTNVRLRLTWGEPPRESGDVYGKVTGVVTREGRRLVRVHLTSVEPADQAVLAAARAGAAAPATATAVSNAAEEPR